MNLFRLSCCFFLLAGLISTVSGCGDSSIGKVTGTVTLDGEPLADVLVSFKPKEGRASAGKTNSDGEYRLRYIKAQMGAVIGEHTVTITAPQIVEETRGKVDYGPDGPVKAARPQARRVGKLLPPRYGNKKTSGLTATVSNGSNSIDFELTNR